jgi:Protein of unknown function (DUF2844)
MRTTMRWVAAVMTMLALGMSAHAELGQAPTWAATSATSAISATRATRLVQHVSSAAAPYTVDETTLSSGTVVREYVGQNGAVFAVIWHGPQMAPLNTLLGTWFPSYLNGVRDARAAHGGSHGPANVQLQGLIVQSGGHMGNFSGRAYLPQALPQGISPDDLQ